LVPLVLVIFGSFVIWGNWLNIQKAISIMDAPQNFSFWPLGIPVGLWLLHYAWKADDEVLAGAATYLLIPYIAPYSMVCLLALLSGKHIKVAIALYLGFYLVCSGRSQKIRHPFFFLDFFIQSIVNVCVLKMFV
jgi:hypothetical protein